MKKISIILFFGTILFLSCNRPTKSDTNDTKKVTAKDSTTVDNICKNDTQVDIDENVTCNKKDIIHFEQIQLDTIIGDVHVSYLIHDNNDVVSTRSYDDKGVPSITFFADREILINITRNNKSILFNRIIKKTDFTSIIPQNEIRKFKISYFQIKEVDNKGATFSVNLCVPDTDNCCPLKLIISNDGKFTIKQIAEDEGL